jgi:hypothetical protein
VLPVLEVITFSIREMTIAKVVNRKLNASVISSVSSKPVFNSAEW